jgi:non-specific protein-tyrosine kinase
MGKIHDALQRAEEERAALGGVTAGVAAQPELREARPAESRPRAARAERAERVRDTRRSRLMADGLETNVTEEFRSLRQRIQSLRRVREVRSIVITSALPGEGKTTTASNLALSFGLQSEQRTCLVDGDLRRPSVHRMLRETPDAGVAEVLEADAKLEEALVEIGGTRLFVLPVRALPTYPSELLASRKMEDMMEELHARFDTVIIDSPPIIGLPDATALVDLADATLLVVSAGVSSRQEISAALERVDRTKILGTVLNRAEDTVAPYGSSYASKAR